MNELPINSIICGDCAEEMAKFPENSIDMIFVDPPYLQKYLYIYEILSKEAARILKPGAFAVFYMSDYWFDKCFISCLKYLDYFYLFHHINTGKHARLFPKKVFADAKTIAVFSKGKPTLISWIGNVIQSVAQKNLRKDNWQQSTVVAMHFIDKLSKENDIILDPNCGSGTTCEAARLLKRNYTGIEIDPYYADISRKRLAELLI